MLTGGAPPCAAAAIFPSSGPAHTFRSMPLPKDIRDDMAARYAEAAREADREQRRDYVVTALTCVFWCAFGVGLVGWSMHTTDLTYGKAAFALGVGGGNGGIIFTLLAAYRRGERRGDW